MQLRSLVVPLLYRANIIKIYIQSRLALWNRMAQPQSDWLLRVEDGDQVEQQKFVSKHEKSQENIQHLSLSHSM